VVVTAAKQSVIEASINVASTDPAELPTVLVGRPTFSTNLGAFTVRLSEATGLRNLTVRSYSAAPADVMPAVDPPTPVSPVDEEEGGISGGGIAGIIIALIIAAVFCAVVCSRRKKQTKTPAKPLKTVATKAFDAVIVEPAAAPAAPVAASEAAPVPQVQPAAAARTAFKPLGVTPEDSFAVANPMLRQ
jgi:hypothetical protein